MTNGEFPAAEPGAPVGAASDRAFLDEFGQRVCKMGAQRGLSRRALTIASGVCERRLAQLEGGEGSLSIASLRRVARATGAPIEDLVVDEPPAQ
jgi:XRE family aerobic/anaerobic benzoate catabolism transcriptional regulator